MLKNKFLTFLSFLAITFSASLIGGLATIKFKEPWYSLLNKPTFNPHIDNGDFVVVTNIDKIKFTGKKFRL